MRAMDPSFLLDVEARKRRKEKRSEEKKRGRSLGDLCHNELLYKGLCVCNTPHGVRDVELPGTVP